MIQEAYLRDVSTRCVGDLVRAMGVSGASTPGVASVQGHRRAGPWFPWPADRERATVSLDHDATDVNVREAKGRIVRDPKVAN